MTFSITDYSQWDKKVSILCNYCYAFELLTHVWSTYLQYWMYVILGVFLFQITILETTASVFIVMHEIRLNCPCIYFRYVSRWKYKYKHIILYNICVNFHTKNDSKSEYITDCVYYMEFISSVDTYSFNYYLNKIYVADSNETVLPVSLKCYSNKEQM